MPIYAISILVQVVCVAHIIRTGRDRIWLYAVVFLPLAGVIAYLLVEILPSMLGGRTAHRLSSQVQRQVDPGRGIRARKRALELADTTENRRLLAEEFLGAGQFGEAANLYEDTLVGIHRDDPALLFGLARARAGEGNYARCLVALDEIAAAGTGPETIERRLFRAICLERLGRTDEARAHYAAIADRYPGEEARCRYARLLAANGQKDEARRLYEEIMRRAKLGNRHYRRAQQQWIDHARQALAAPAG